MQMESSLNMTNKRRVIVMLPLLFGGFMAILNETILNTALPQLMTSLKVSMTTIQWLSTGYMLVIGISVPVAAFLIKTFSARNLFVTAMSVFCVGTVFCGFATSFSELLLFRILQGAGTGMLLPIMMNTIVEIFPQEKRGTAIGLCMMVIVAAPGIGPTIAGVIMQLWGWRWLFFLILPLGILTTIAGFIILRNYSELTRPKMDIPSIILSTLGFGGLLFSICSLEEWGLTSMIVIVSFLVGAVALWMFSKRQFTIAMPMLNLRIFRFPMFTLGAVVMFIVFMMPFAVNIILPTYMQNSMGLSVFLAGIALLPGCVVNVVAAPVAGMLFDRIGIKPLLLTGFIALTIAMFFLSRISITTSLAMIIVLQAIMTFGVGSIATPIQTSSLNSLPPKDRADGIAMLNTIQQIAAAFGSSLFIGLMGASQAKYLSEVASPDKIQERLAIITGTHYAFTVALIVVIIGLIIALFIKQDEIREKKGVP